MNKASEDKNCDDSGEGSRELFNALTRDEQGMATRAIEALSLAPHEAAAELIGQLTEEQKSQVIKEVVRLLSQQPLDDYVKPCEGDSIDNQGADSVRPTSSESKTENNDPDSKDIGPLIKLALGVYGCLSDKKKALFMEDLIFLVDRNTGAYQGGSIDSPADNTDNPGLAFDVLERVAAAPRANPVTLLNVDLEGFQALMDLVANIYGRLPDNDKSRLTWFLGFALISPPIEIWSADSTNPAMKVLNRIKHAPEKPPEFSAGDFQLLIDLAISMYKGLSDTEAHWLILELCSYLDDYLPHQGDFTDSQATAADKKYRLSINDIANQILHFLGADGEPLSVRYSDLHIDHSVIRGLSGVDGFAAGAAATTSKVRTKIDELQTAPASMDTATQELEAGTEENIKGAGAVLEQIATTASALQRVMSELVETRDLQNSHFAYIANRVVLEIGWLADLGTARLSRCKGDYSFSEACGSPEQWVLPNHSPIYREQLSTH